MSVSPEYKRFFAEEIRAIGALKDDQNTNRVLAAFTRVPREQHVGKGPWLLYSPLNGFPARRTPDANPEHLYHNVLISLDEEKGINIGDPSLWARLLSQTVVAEGTSVLQVGTGSGYYTSILSELVGPGGRILATETDERLFDIAVASLRGRSNVEVKHANGAIDLTSEDGPFDLVIAFAGVTQPARQWLDRLSPQGRMLLPVTGKSQWGAMVLAVKDHEGFSARSLGRCGFFPCVGARDKESEVRVDELWSDNSRLSDTEFRMRIEGQRVIYELSGCTD